MTQLQDASELELVVVALSLCLLGVVAGVVVQMVRDEAHAWRRRWQAWRWRRWLAMDVVDRRPPRGTPDSDREDQA